MLTRDAVEVPGAKQKDLERKNLEQMFRETLKRAYIFVLSVALNIAQNHNA